MSKQVAEPAQSTRARDSFRKVHAECLRLELAERDARLAWEAASEAYAMQRAEVEKAKDALIQDAIGCAVFDFIGATELVKETQKRRAEGYSPDEETVRAAHVDLLGDRPNSVPPVE